MRCGEAVDQDMVTIDDSVIVVEVVSPLSSTIDRDAKLEGYFRLPSVPHYLIVKARERRVIYHRWDEAGRIETGS